MTYDDAVAWLHSASALAVPFVPIEKSEEALAVLEREHEDAGRYATLKSAIASGAVMMHFHDGIGWTNSEDPESLDAAIDAARGKK